eukprot:gene2055-3036_t
MVVHRVGDRVGDRVDSRDSRMRRCPGLFLRASPRVCTFTPQPPLGKKPLAEEEGYDGESLAGEAVPELTARRNNVTGGRQVQIFVKKNNPGQHGSNSKITKWRMRFDRGEKFKDGLMGYSGSRDPTHQHWHTPTPPVQFNAKLKGFHSSGACVDLVKKLGLKPNIRLDDNLRPQASVATTKHLKLPRSAQHAKTEQDSYAGNFRWKPVIKNTPPTSAEDPEF